MMISRAEINSAVSVQRTAKRKPAAGAASAAAADSFERSDAATSLAAFWSAATAEPFYRHGVVQELGRRISEGQYFVPAEQIVEKLLGRLVVHAAFAAA
jgi:anti-sigma28 factor (negative regulator of flagellin synthesis)